MADVIARARAEGRTIDAPVGGRPLSTAEAYAVQRLRTRDRLDRGERVVGWKLGYTSAAMREQMGVSSPNHGPLTDAMLLASGGRLPASVLQPRVEPEVALVLATDLAGDVGRAAAGAAVARALPALEVVDSVWTGYRFTLEDNTADGSSAAYVVLGDREIDAPVDALDTVGAVLEIDGAEVGRGRGADAMGHPLDALAWLAARLSEQGETLRAGDVVITGGLTAAVALEPGSAASATVGAARVSVTRSDGSVT